MKFSGIQTQRGQIIILSVVFLAILMTMSTALVGYTVLHVAGSRQAVGIQQALNLAEAGVDKGLYEMNRNLSYTGETATSLGPGQFTISVSSIDADNKLITSTGYIPSAADPKVSKTVKMQVTIDTSSVAFNFGVQVGNGGITLDNNSQINGNLFSNGNITGGGGGNGTVTGDAVVATGTAVTADYNCSANNSSISTNSNARQDLAQEFVPSTGGPLNKVAVYLKKTGSPNDLSVRVVTDNAGVPSTNQLGSTATIPASTVGTSFGFVESTFSTPPTLTIGNNYWVILDSSTTSSNYFSWGDDSTGSCSGSKGQYSDNWTKNPTPTWSAANADFNLKTYMGGVATSLSDIRVNGNAIGQTLTSCNISLDATFEGADTDCSVGGTKYPNSTIPSPEPMPISDSQIASWRASASSGGVINGDYTVNGSEIMGPVEINGDLTVNGTLTLAGPVWVNGNATFLNGSFLNVDPALGDAGAVFLADHPANRTLKGVITVANDVIISGNGNSGSYPMVASTFTGGTAIDLNNNVAGAIFYSANGIIRVAQNVTAQQLTGYGIHLSENAIVNYSLGLASSVFSNGPGGSWVLVRGTYVIEK